MSAIPIKRGAVTDRPWGRLLAELATDRVTGELVVVADGKRHAIGFEAGKVTSAASPAAADSIARIALTSHLISSSQVTEIVRRIAASPGRDELDLVAEVARLSPEHRALLRRRLVVQRAARTFAVERGTYELHERSGQDAAHPEAIDVRCIVYLGARMHVSEPRLTNELRALGARFVLRLDATGELARFELTPAEQPILDALRSGATIAELEATHRDLDPRVIAAVIYALATTDACSATGARRVETEPAVARTVTPTSLVNARVSTKDLPQPAVPRTITPPPAVPRTFTPPPAVPRTFTPPPAVPRTITSQPAVSRTMTPPLLPRTATDNVLLTRTPTKDRTPEWREGREAFQRGEMAVRRDQIVDAVAEFARAVELQPQNADYLATLAWARFCAAKDKAAIAAETRKTIDGAIKSVEEAITPWLCLGRVERMLGRDAEALTCFYKVLELQPHNTIAGSEVRVLEARLRR